MMHYELCIIIIIIILVALGTSFTRALEIMGWDKNYYYYYYYQVLTWYISFKV